MVFFTGGRPMPRRAARVALGCSGAGAICKHGAATPMSVAVPGRLLAWSNIDIEIAREIMRRWASRFRIAQHT